MRSNTVPWGPPAPSRAVIAWALLAALWPAHAFPQERTDQAGAPTASSSPSPGPSPSPSPSPGPSPSPSPGPSPSPSPGPSPSPIATSTSTSTPTPTPTSTSTPTPSPSSPPAARPPPPPTVELEDQVVRLPRAQASGDPLAAATVVEAARFAGEAKGVAELAATAPGVAVNDYGGLGQLSTVSIRGSMSNGVLVLLDGLPLQSATGTGADLASIPRHWVTRLEVLRGAEGAYFGAGALAGVVNVVTRRPEAGAWSAEAGLGSFSTFTAGGDLAAAAGPWTVFAAAALDGTRGDFPYDLDPTPGQAGDALVRRRREHNGALRGGALLKADRRLGAWRLDGLVQASAGRRDLPGPRFHLTPRDWQEDGRLLASLRLAGPGPVPGGDLSLRVHARTDWLDLLLEPAAVQRQRGAAGGLDGELVLSHPGGQARAQLAASGEALSAAALGGGRARGTVGLGLSDDATWLAGRLRLSPGVRAEAVGPFIGWSGKLGASLALADALTLRTSGGRTFRAPGFAELYLQQGLVDPNPALGDETAWTGDAALVLDGTLGLLSLGGFAQLYRELILYQQASAQRLKPFNAGKALISGLELEAALSPRRTLWGLEASGSYTYLATENLRAPPGALGRELPFRARHRIYGRVGLAPGPAEVHLEAHHVGRQFVDPANTPAQAIPATTLWNAGASVRLWPRHDLRLHLEVKNLGDARTLLDNLGDPLPSRMVLLTLRAGSPPQGAP